MKYASPFVRVIAKRLPIYCAIYFGLFSYLFQRWVECDVLAQAQFQLSEGATVYHPSLYALFCTLLLLLPGLLLHRFCHWLPLRLLAVNWLPSFLLLGLLCHWRFPEVGDTASAPSWWWVAVTMVAWAVLLYMGWGFRDSTKESSTFATYAWPNALLLALFSVISVSFANTDIRTHRTLAALRLAEEGQWQSVLRQAHHEQHPPRQLSMLTARALSQTGQLADRLFAYPQPWGAEGLLPLEGDTLLFHSLPRLVGHHLRYLKSDRTTLDLLFVAVDTDAAQPLRHYHLAALLLERRLPEFAQLLRQDSTLSPPLPRHYAEALALLSPTDSLAPIDSSVLQSLQSFDSLRLGTSPLLRSRELSERRFQCHRRYGDTYWFYFYFPPKNENEN